MLKRCIFTLLLCIGCAAAVVAAPAYPRPVVHTQPDGTTITIVGHGDERCHYATTTDGYTVVLADDGFYHYASKKGDKLVATNVRANNAEQRQKGETKFLSTLTKHLHAEPSATARRLGMMTPAKSFFQKNNGKQQNAKTSGGTQPYRGLVILVNFNDCKFSRGNEATKEIYTQMINGKGFTGYDDPLLGTHEVCTGSMRDYFYDNSYGKFDPEFDVIGPIDINRSQYYIDGVNNTYELVEHVLETINPQVDFSRYDSNGDGDVDMFYIIYAGYTSSYEGNDARLVWPHAADLIDPEGEVPDVIYDGVRLGRFACSSEVYGWKKYNDLQLDGIGVMCHEFSHVLGFQDHYDVLGYQEHPNTWDIMAAGSYNGEYNRTPCAYNSYEKAVAGFIKPLDISDFDGQQVTLRSTETSEDACIIHSNQPRVSFFMENRQHDKWDIPLIGHGLLVWRVDSVYNEPWDLNMLNVTERTCFKLIRSNGTQGNMMIGVEDKPFDPFPGTGNVTVLDNEPKLANLLSHDRIASPVVLNGITENTETGEVAFVVNIDPESDDKPITYTLPSKMTMTAEHLEGDEWVPVKWTSFMLYDETNRYIMNLLPNETVKVRYYYDISGTTIGIDGQRVSVGDDFSLWLCNQTSVDEGGSGTMKMKVSRSGIPSLTNMDDIIGYYKLKPSAYVISQRNLIEKGDSYRNLRFYPFGTVVDGIEMIQTERQTSQARGVYNVLGQSVSNPAHGLYIINGRKVFVK